MPQARTRHVELSNVFNLRDMGGYRTAGGETVAWGHLYRADGLNRLDEADAAILAPLGLRTIIDLRTHGERDRWGVAPEQHLGGRIVHLPLLVELWDRAELEAEVDHDPVAYLVERYLEMTEQGAPAIAEIVHLAADHPERLPLVFHCSAGKDRTGVTAAILLALLGVDHHTIAEDYALTAPAMTRLVAWVRARIDERDAQGPAGTRDGGSTNPLADADDGDTMADQPPTFLACPPEAMLGFLEAMRARHGSIESFVKGLGVPSAVLDDLRHHHLV